MEDRNIPNNQPEMNNRSEANSRGEKNWGAARNHPRFSNGPRRRALVALLMGTDNNMMLAMSSRELADYAEIPQRTACQVIRDLLSTGHLRQLKPPYARDPGVYLFAPSKAWFRHLKDDMKPAWQKRIWFLMNQPARLGIPVPDVDLFETKKKRSKKLIEEFVMKQSFECNPNHGTPSEGVEVCSHSCSHFCSHFRSDFRSPTGSMPLHSKGIDPYPSTESSERAVMISQEEKARKAGGGDAAPAGGAGSAGSGRAGERDGSRSLPLGGGDVVPDGGPGANGGSGAGASSVDALEGGPAPAGGGPGAGAGAGPTPTPPVPRTPPSPEQQNPSRKRRKTKKEEQLEFSTMVFPPEWAENERFMQVWADWVEHRSEMRRPLTKAAIRMQIRDLKKIAEQYGVEGVIASIEQSIKNGWQGLFEPKQVPQPSEKPAAQSSKPEPATPEPAIPPILDTPKFREAWAKWLRYNEEIKRPLPRASMEEQLDALRRLGSELAAVSIRRAIANGWKTLVHPYTGEVLGGGGVVAAESQKTSAGKSGANGGHQRGGSRPGNPSANLPKPPSSEELMMEEQLSALQKAFEIRQADGGDGIPTRGCYPDYEDWRSASSADDLLWLIMNWRKKDLNDNGYHEVAFLMVERAKWKQDWPWMIKRYYEIEEFIDKYLRRVVPGGKLPDDWPVWRLFKAMYDAIDYAQRVWLPNGKVKEEHVELLKRIEL